jgi:hypothetical protein
MRRDGRRSSAWLALASVLLVLLGVGWMVGRLQQSESTATAPVVRDALSRDEALHDPVLPSRVPAAAMPIGVPDTLGPAEAPAARATRSIAFLVVDTSGQPIADAQLYNLLDFRVGVAFTGFDGQASLTLKGSGSTDVTVAAGGYSTVQAQLPTSGQADLGPVRVTLERTSELDVSVSDPAGGPAARIDVSLAFPPRVLASDGSTPSSTELPARRSATDSSGHCSITELLPEVPFELAIHDRYGMQLLPSLPLSLQRGEARELHLVLPSHPISLQVHVRDHLGLPIAGALVSLSTRLPAESMEQRWDFADDAGEDGVVVFDAISASSVAVQATKSCYATAWLSNVSLTNDPTVVTLTLDPERTIDVAIVDDAGNSLNADRVVVAVGLLVLPGNHIGPGRYRFNGLPAGKVRITAELANQIWEQFHDTSEPRATISIARLGGLDLDWAVADPVAFGFALQLTRVDDSAQPGTTFWTPIERGSERDRGRTVISQLLPASYAICLVQRGYGVRPDVQLSGVERVTIDAGVTTRASLRP